MTTSGASKRHRHTFPPGGERCLECGITKEMYRELVKDARKSAAIENAKEREAVSQMELWPGLPDFKKRRLQDLGATPLVEISEGVWAVPGTKMF